MSPERLTRKPPALRLMALFLPLMAGFIVGIMLITPQRGALVIAAMVAGAYAIIVTVGYYQEVIRARRESGLRSKDSELTGQHRDAIVRASTWMILLWLVGSPIWIFGFWLAEMPTFIYIVMGAVSAVGVALGVMLRLSGGRLF